MTDLFLVFCLAVGIILLCHRLRIPPILGFLFTGMLAGPHGLELVRTAQDVEYLAEIGVMLLLFTIGLEFSFGHLMEIRRSVLLGGGLQVTLTTLSTALLVKLLGWTWAEAVFMGCLISLSSTAIVLKLLQDQAGMETPHGRTMLGILIFQDLMVVPMILLVPLLSGQLQDPVDYLSDFAMKAAGLAVIITIATRWVVPKVLHGVAHTRNREAFLLSILAICMGVAGMTAHAGLSMALGAFLAGLVISESPFAVQAISSVLPFRDVFTSLFFVSIGMLLDLGFVVEHPVEVSLLSLGVILLKTGASAVAARALKQSPGTFIAVGFSLAQVGEFAFVLSRSGLEAQLLSGQQYQYFLAFSVITMAATPFLIRIGTTWASRRQRTAPRPEEGLDRPASAAPPRRDHVIVVGFGPTGHMLARGMRAAGLPYMIVESNPETVRRQRAQGESIFFGDATSEEVLRHAGLEHARTMMITVPMPAVALEVVHLTRRLHPGIHILVRTPFLGEMDAFHRAGANEVVPVDQEMAVALFQRLLGHYLLPQEDIQRLLAQVRQNDYRVLLQEGQNQTSFSAPMALHELSLSSVQLDAASPLCALPLRELNLRSRFAVSVVAARRNNELISNPAADFTPQEGDWLYLLGRPEHVHAATTSPRTAPG
ncbi:MAG: cation:proton antiporter [Magnetococcus sp. WYHC-3]